MIDISIYEASDRKVGMIEELTEVWEKSVSATHKFLSKEEIENIKKYVPQALNSVEHLVIAKKNEKLIAFMGVEKQKLEMLFLSPNETGKELGKQLLQYGINNFGINQLTVNEQNPLAKGFYEHMGFTVYKRSDLDEQGNPYPILYMQR